jgi:death on curing protein
MNEPIWLPLEVIIDLHAEQLARFGGPDGIRDRGLLESAVGRPINRWAYGETRLGALSASYAFGLARNHAFIDGNKRIAFQAMMTFLRLNGVRFAPLPAHATAIMIALAAGEISEEGLTDWILDYWPEG